MEDEQEENQELQFCSQLSEKRLKKEEQSCLRMRIRQIRVSKKREKRKLPLEPTSLGLWKGNSKEDF